jgi:hypothetical protein
MQFYTPWNISDRSQLIKIANKTIVIEVRVQNL